jgi:hypothetical protein
MTQAVLGQQGLQSQLFGQGANLFGAGQTAQQNQNALALQNILGGGNLLTGSGGLNISALNALSNLAGTQNQGYSALSNLLGTSGGIANNQLQGLQGIQNFGLQSQNDLYSTLNNLFGQQNNLANQSQAGLFAAAGFPQNTYNQNLGFLQSLANNNVGLFGGNVAPTNYFAQGGSQSPLQLLAGALPTTKT